MNNCENAPAYAQARHRIVTDPSMLEGQVGEYRRALQSPSRRAQEAIKRLLDVLGAACGLLLTGPLLGVMAVLIRLESPGPGFYSQRRLGRGGHVFRVFKLRSMVHRAPMMLNSDGSTWVTPHDPRLTRMGARLRPRGLDELPQLWNVLKGEMSLIGPRPDHDFQLQRYAEGDYRKLAMRPGMTSLAQVSGRNALPWRRRMEIEIEYVERFSLWLDLQIALRTVGVVLRGSGAYNSGRGDDAGPPTIVSRDH